MTNAAPVRTETKEDAALRQWARKNLDQACVVCGHTGDRDNPLEVDHIIPWSVNKDLRYSKDNVQMMCRVHNRSKSNKTTQEVRLAWFDRTFLPESVVTRF